MHDIFIVGSPRSGTTWLQRMLGADPTVASPPELYLFSEYLAPADQAWSRTMERFEGEPSANIVGLPTVLHRDVLDDWMRTLYAEVRSRALLAKPGATRFLTKTPADALHLPLIRTVVPEARFVHIVRDPRDVVASIHAIRREGGWPGIPDDTVVATNLWLSHVGAATRHADARDTMVVRYEDLCRDVEASLAGVTSFLQLPGPPGEPGSSPGSGSGSGSGPLVAPGALDLVVDPTIDDQDVKLSLHPELAPADQWYIERRCADLMARFGYQPELPSAGPTAIAWRARATALVNGGHLGRAVRRRLTAR